MKKVFTTTALFVSMLTLSSIAQESDFKPAAGANNLELNFVPLNGKPIQLTYIRYRRFLSEKTALRVGIGLSYSSSKADSVFMNPTNPDQKEVQVYKSTKFGWSIKPGFEKHFEGTNRLSPYIGAELDLAGQSAKEVTPTSYNFTDNKPTIVTEKNKSKGGFFRAGVNLLAGFDCYITKHLYLGSELGFGFQYVKYSDYKKETDPLAPNAKNPDPVSQGKEMNIGPNFNSSIRLGYIF